MKLTRLRLHGFKSFVEPTDFLIEPGLTGVVGPNGCGKSNLVEALRWVMGESSHKAMRAAEMNDVIFSGTNGRPARNMAEVGMTLDNADRTAPAAFNEDEILEISRRIVRDDGSNYRINGREVRARDVQILFADASTGSRSPALVHQGRIGEIIQAKPEQRRRVLEEAAGIAGLHVRRHESELRLRAAEQNLARVEDVIGQLASQIDGLKRQARQALRYKAVAAQIRKTEATLFHLRHGRAMQDVADAVQAHDLSIRLVAERTGVQTEAVKQQAILAADMPPLREAEAAAAAGLQRLNAARDALDRDEARARERLAELERRITQFESDGARERTMIADSQTALDRLAAEAEALRAEIQARADLRSGADRSVAEATAALAEIETVFGEVTREHADQNARRNRLESERRSLGDRAARLMRELEEVRAERARLDTDAPPADLDALGAAVEAALQALAEGESAHRAAEQAHAEAREAFEARRSALNEAERRAQRLETEARTIAKLLAVESKNMWPPVMDAIAVEKGYEKALGAALGDDLDAPCDASAPMRWALTAAPEPDAPLPEGVEPLSRAVQGPPELARRLAQIGVVTREQAATLALSLRPGQRLVSLDGDLWRWDGFVAGAHAPTGAARRLAERGRLSAIEAELVTARSETETSRASLTEAERHLAEAVAAQSAARDATRTLQREVDQARERLATAEREVNRHAARRSALDEAQARIASGHSEAAQAHAQAEEAFAALPPSAEIEARLADVRSQIEARRARAAEARAEAQAVAREAELADRRLHGIAQETAEWRKRHDSAERQISEIDTRSTEAIAERDGLRDAPSAFEERRRALLDEIRTAEEARRAAADRLATAENGLAEADRAARAALEGLSAAREESGRAEERAEAARRRLDDLVQEIREVLETEPTALAALAELPAGSDLPPTADVEAELDKLRRDRERLGAVNLRAEEELREVEAQHNGLVTERDDLIEAIKRLRQGIQGLNREARERLLASFEVVNGHFQRLFVHLFGGGTAELHLIENDDPLEAGLEIIAKPPGKKPQTLSLLSGGEQALTAMALIFAVFLTNPAPICVLDEVDAPLDDHNVERFCDLLHEMTKTTDTRFVIITHNPITMARMNRLYGVTMAERGVSQLVSVDLERAVRMRDAS